ncbi:MAG TPA: glycosyltransferase family 4 protein [Sphingomonadaceae bacterium]|nr:glycosyltransferase family 4 protein [Sphingomonadaceae bacterium]
MIKDSSVPQTMKAVVAHAGSRDHYQLALALYEAEQLANLVTELYVSPRIVEALAALGLGTLSRFLAKRSAAGLDRPHIRAMPRTLLSQRRAGSSPNPAAHWAAGDSAISRAALSQARKLNAALFLYSYYAYEAFTEAGSLGIPRILFQLHPHPVVCRRIFEEEMRRVPAAAASIGREKEMLIGERELERLAQESALADHIVVASSFTKRTLIEQGISEARVSVIPYGVDVEAFPTRTTPPPSGGPLRIVFVGSFVQRKGMSYLLDAVAAFPAGDVKLIVATRKIDWPELPAFARSDRVEFKLGLSRDELVQLLHGCDVFALPSLIEGFGLVITEAMATGLPVIATDHTCAGDIVEGGETGFVVPIRDAAALIAAIQKCLDRRTELFAMGQKASEAARRLTWPLFRRNVSDHYRSLMERR